MLSFLSHRPTGCEVYKSIDFELACSHSDMSLYTYLRIIFLVIHTRFSIIILVILCSIDYIMYLQNYSLLKVTVLISDRFLDFILLFSFLFMSGKYSSARFTLTFRKSTVINTRLSSHKRKFCY